MRRCYEASDLHTESAEIISHFFPHLVSKFPVVVITKKESRLDQGQEGQGIVFLVVICDLVCLDIGGNVSFKML